jgi:thiamine-monophosphate kinase
MVVPDRWRPELADVADGIADVLRPSGARIIGGNLSRGDAFGITTTVIGSCVRPIARRGALPGDRLLVTGLLGGPGLAVAALDAGAVPAPWARERFATPVPRLREGQRLADAGVHAMLDISDGLVADARHLAAASGMRLRLNGDGLPLGPGISPRQALVSGEEYELLIAASVEVAAALLADWGAHFAVALTDVGSVVEPCDGGAVEVVGEADGLERVEFVLGHDHFTT